MRATVAVALVVAGCGGGVAVPAQSFTSEPVPSQAHVHPVLEGRVLDGKTRAPLVGANVIASGGNVSAIDIADAQGHFVIDVPPTGTVSVTAHLEDRQATVTVVVPSEQARTLEIVVP